MLGETCLRDIDTVVLAGGAGTRLRSVYADRPKVLVPIRGKPFLRHCLEWLERFGARRVVLALGYKADMVQDYVKTQDWRGLEILPSVEAEPLDTGGAVRAALPQLRSPTVLVLNGDSLTRVDLCEFVKRHRATGALLSIVLTHQPDVKSSGLVETNENGLVTSFREKPPTADAGGHISAGIYLMEQEAIREIEPDRRVSIEREVFPRFCGRKFYAMKGNYPFIDVGTPESLQRAAEFFAEEAA
jgi:NDP-sugar pyrophosphorylase family protein